MTEFAVPIAFHFSVRFAGEEAFVSAFQEVSGLETDLDVGAVEEGGKNRFVHQLPKPAKRGNLKLKRGLTERNSALVSWCKDAIEGGFAKPIEPKELTVALLNETGDAVAEWTVQGAFPVKWSVGGFDAMKNELAIETVELSYNQLTRNI